MDRTSIIVIVVCLILIGLWTTVLTPKLFPPKPLPAGATNAVSGSPTNQTLVTNEVARSNSGPKLEETISAAQPVTNAIVPEQLLELTHDQVRYVFTSHGGGLKEIDLLGYPETVSTRREKTPETDRVATLNRHSPAPSLAVLGGADVQGDNVFTLTRTGEVVRVEKVLTNGLSIVKEFQFGSNYLVTATVTLENHSPAPLNLPLQEWAVGTATPIGPRDNGTAVGVLWYDGTKSQTDVSAPWFNPRSFIFFPGIPRSEYRAGASNVVWVAAHNQFFTLVAIPRSPAQEMVVRKIDLPRFTGDEAKFVAANAPPPVGFETALVYPAMTLAPNQKLERQITLYAGPKEYQTLARIAGQLNNNLDLVMNYGGFFGFFSKALLIGMNGLHNSLRFSYGWAIIAITVLIKLIFWPLTQASTRSMKRMQALQPQMNAIKEKYKDDPMKMNRKTMEFMREHKVSPIGGCLPMVLQIPVFFGFYRMIQSAIELRGAHFLWVGDLSKPDTLFIIPGLSAVPFIGIPGVGLPFNLLPLIMGVTMLVQARLTPPSPGMDPTQQKIMRYMPLMFMVFLYNFSAGLTLYWTVQNLLTIAQTKLTKMKPEPPPSGKAPVLTAGPKKRK
jgi:YidC/Oxa1 family membrane protein insertase